MANIPAKIRNDELWKSVYKLAQTMYRKTTDMVVEFPEEQWRSAGKLRNAANDALFYTSLAIGNSAEGVSTYDWGAARKNIFTVQAMYTFAAKQKFLELEPELILHMDNLIVEVDKRIIDAKELVKEQEKKELEPWMEKYRIWQKLQK